MRKVLLLIATGVLTLQVVAQRPDVAALYNEAYRLQRDYKPDEAMRCLRRALTIDSTFLPALNLMGYIYEDAYVRYDSALMTYRHILDIDSNYTKAYLNIGHIFFLQKQYAECVMVNNHAIATDSTCAEAYFNIGWVYNLRGDLRQSLHYLAKAALLGSDEAIRFFRRNGYQEDFEEFLLDNSDTVKPQRPTD